MRRRAARARADKLLAQLGIGRYRDTYPGQLSGGERQRVATAEALVNKPGVLLDLNAAGQTLLIVTHNPELAERYASRVIQLADGRVSSDTGAAVPTGQPGLAGAGVRP